MSNLNFKYVRIQGKELAKNTMYAKGIFSMCWQLIQDDVMTEEDVGIFKEIDKDNILVESYDRPPRQKAALDPSKRFSFADDRLVLTEEQIQKETSRCPECGAAHVVKRGVNIIRRAALNGIEKIKEKSSQDA